MAKNRAVLIPKDASATPPTRISEARSLSHTEMAFQGGKLFVKNDAQVETGLIRRILTPIPRLPFRLAILLSDGYLPHRMLGLDPGSGMLPRPCLPLQIDPDWLAGRLPGRWDCAIHIAKRTCTLAREYPVYFALTLLQELAHARIAHRDLALHMVHCMLFDLMWNDALRQGRRILEFDRPGEKQCMRVALRQARRIFGPRRVGRELGPFVDSPSEVREYAECLSLVDPDEKDRNLYEETRFVASTFAHRLLGDWKSGDKKLRQILRRKDLRRIIGP